MNDHYVTGVNKETFTRHVVSQRMSLMDCIDFVRENEGVWGDMKIINWKTRKEVKK